MSACTVIQLALIILFNDPLLTLCASFHCYTLHLYSAYMHW